MAATHVKPASRSENADGMLNRVAMMNATMKTRRPLRRVSGSPGYEPIERTDSRNLLHLAVNGIVRLS